MEIIIRNKTAQVQHLAKRINWDVKSYVEFLLYVYVIKILSAFCRSEVV